ncbi:MAG TPA: dethiobiotin synthase [Acidimicrobiales bacterium]|nr:dethiobiotin synthase [Acidimicrobiales bacterium]
MSRPERLVGVCGTATEVGKTWVGATLLTELRRRGRAVAARKPLQSFDPDDAVPTDAEVLSAATGEDPYDVCPPDGWFPVPMAPPMAAEALGRRCPTLAEVVASITWPAACDLGVVETVGGVRSPLAEDGDSCDLVVALDVDVVLLVADAGLGTIDAVRAAVDALAPLPVVTVLNRYDEVDDLHRRNLTWLTERDGYDVVNRLEDAIELLR